MNGRTEAGGGTAMSVENRPLRKSMPITGVVFVALFSVVQVPFIQPSEAAARSAQPLQGPER